MAKLNPKQELFCKFYSQNRETLGNATHSYAEAYNYDLDSLSRESKHDVDGKLVENSEYDKSIHVCAVEGRKLLRKPVINDRITQLLNEWMTEQNVDGELAKVIQQDRDLNSKVAAVREFNKLKARITDKIEVITPDPIYGGSSVQRYNGDKKNIRTQKKN